MADRLREEVPAPRVQQPKVGLLASIPPETDIGDRWMGGIKYTPEGCIEGERFDICEEDTELEDETPPQGVEWDPFYMSLSIVCSAFSANEDFSIDEELARRVLAMDTERQLGQELWDGTKAKEDVTTPNTWLTDATDPAWTDLSPDGPVGLVHGLACLQNYISHNNGGQPGAIHATSQAVTHWESFRLLRRENNKILTMEDNLVIPSPGYSGNPPSGESYGEGNVAATDDIWAYATDMPRIYLGKATAAPRRASFDRSTNTIRVVAQRPALVEWERCRHAGVRLCLTMCGNEEY